MCLLLELGDVATPITQTESGGGVPKKNQGTVTRRENGCQGGRNKEAPLERADASF